MCLCVYICYMTAIRMCMCVLICACSTFEFGTLNDAYTNSSAVVSLSLSFYCMRVCRTSYWLYAWHRRGNFLLTDIYKKKAEAASSCRLQQMALAVFIGKIIKNSEFSLIFPKKILDKHYDLCNVDFYFKNEIYLQKYVYLYIDFPYFRLR